MLYKISFIRKYGYMEATLVKSDFAGWENMIPADCERAAWTYRC